MTSQPPFPSMPCMADFDLLTQFFKGFPRKGPGSESSTRRALAHCALGPAPAVADFGCGSGAATLVLAQDLQVPVLGLDADGRSLDDLWHFARARGLSDRVRPTCADMADPGLPPGSLDLLWSEGAISSLGWERGLAAWRDLVRPGGFLAITDAVWFTDDPPAPAKAFWQAWYPAMATVPRQLQAVRDQGLEVVAHFPLPSADWWAYFEPVAARCREWAGRAEFADLCAGMCSEMDHYRRYGHSYGYEFIIMRRT
jgi:SAM-dependent methyltransferase